MITRTNNELLGGEERIAIFSDNEKFRFALDIIWDPNLKPMMVIGLNPSVADEMKDDRTVARCKCFARTWGYGGLLMRNIFAYRETQRLLMLKLESDVIGNPQNDRHIVDGSHCAGLVIAAWGADGGHLDRDKQVVALVPKLHCLRRTKGGNPEHPLYMPGSTKPIPFNF